MKLILGLGSAVLLTSTFAFAQPAQPEEPVPALPPAEPAPAGAPAAPVPAPAPLPATPAPGPQYQPAAPAPLPAAGIRSGFTAMLSIGYGMTKIDPDNGNGNSQTEGGLAGLNIELGGYVSPELAILISIGGTSFTIDTFGDDINFYNGYFGPIAQYWVNPQFFLGGGAGLGIFGVTNNDNIESESGLALTARAGYRFAGGLQGMLGITPSFYDGATVTSTSFLLAYQWD